MNTHPWFLLSTLFIAGCASEKPVELKQKEEALHRGLTEAGKKADPAKNLKEASDAIRSFKISDAADAGIRKHQAKTRRLKQTAEKAETQSKPSPQNLTERKTP